MDFESAKEADRPSQSESETIPQNALHNEAIFELSSRASLPAASRTANPLAIPKETRLSGGDANNEHWNNARLAQLHKSDYKSLDDLRPIEAALKEMGTLHLMRNPDGGADAITPVDDKAKSLAQKDGLNATWLRDSAFQVLAEELGDSKLSGENTDQAKLGIKFGLDTMTSPNQESRFLNIIKNGFSLTPWAKLEDQDGQINDQVPQVRFRDDGQQQSWGHNQIDALAFNLFTPFNAINEGRIQADDPSVAKAEEYATLLFNYFNKVDITKFGEKGAWEDTTAVHNSSLGVAYEGLKELSIYMGKQHKDQLSYKASDGTLLTVNKTELNDMMTKIKSTIDDLGTLEAKYKGYWFDRNQELKPGLRTADLAELNPIMLSIFGRDDAHIDLNHTIALVDNVEKNLRGEYAIRRFNGDTWQGNWNDRDQPGRPDWQPEGEAEWTFGNAELSAIDGWLYEKTGDKKYLEKEESYFNRMLATVDEDGKIPEAWIKGEKNGHPELPSNAVQGPE